MIESTNVISEVTLHDAMISEGFNPPEQIYPGKTIRFPTNGKPSDTSGWITMFPDEQGAVFGCWRSGEKHTWQAKSNKTFTREERIEFKRNAELAKEVANKEREETYKLAAIKASKEWWSSNPVDNTHLYLQSKGIDPNIARVDGNGCLLIPVYGDDNELQSLQRIAQDGAKRFFTGGCIAGGHLWIGEPKNGSTLLLSESFSTSSSLHQATGYAVCISFSASNLPAIAEMIHKQYPDSKKLVCGDDDTHLTINTGRINANSAANIANCKAVFPPNNNDFNDMAQADGLDAVRDFINKSLSEIVIDTINKSSTHNNVLDDDSKYCHVDLLQHLDDSHLLKRLSKQTAEVANLPESTVALMGLSVFSSMSARKWVVTYKNKAPLPIGLYSVAEQPSGTGKSRCLGIFQKPFFAALKESIKNTRDRLNCLEGNNDLSELDQQELAALKKQNIHLFITNTTPEALESTLDDTKGFFSTVSSEQGLFDSLLGLSYGKTGTDKASTNNNDATLHGFDCGYHKSTRVSRKGYAGHVVGSVVCFAQTGSIEKVLDSSNGTGLSERFLMIAEPHMLGKRDHTKSIHEDESLMMLYGQACDFATGVLENPQDIDELNQLIISDNGHYLIAKYQNQIEQHIGDGGKYSHISLRGAASKINMQIMKIAANLHLLDRESYQPNIPDRHVISAIGIANELLEGNLKLCVNKGIIGVKAEFTSILTLFEREKVRTERIIITTKVKASPFKDFTGNKSDLIRKTINEMVSQGLLTKLVLNGKPAYQIGQ